MHTLAQLRQVRREQAKSLIRANSGTLGYWATWAGNSYWLSPCGEVAIAYRVVKNVAIALVQPFSARPVRDADLQEFNNFCLANRWTPTFFALQHNLIGVFETSGWNTLSVGQEAMISLPDFDLSSSGLAKVRHSYNRSQRAEVEAVWTSWLELSERQQHDIRVLSRHWESRKRLRKMGFTIGGLKELMDPDVRLMLGVDAAGHVIAVTSWLPVYRDQEIVGWTLDFMRRSHNSFSGITEYLIGSTVERARLEGMAVLSLSGVPLVQPNPDINPRGRRMLLRLVARRLDTLYGFSSLFFFKQKFNPELQPIYLAYPATVKLPRILFAVARAYLPA